MFVDVLTLRSLLGISLTWPRWYRAGFPTPVPRSLKRHVLARYSTQGGTWVESGTYLGDTTRWLSRRAANVVSIEPSVRLAERAMHRFRKTANVRIVLGLSEKEIDSILSNISGDVYLWLDGHASGGFTHLGPKVTPIREELAAISHHSKRFSKLSVFVDDWRGFGTPNTQDLEYPLREELVDWAKMLGLNWTVEYDIFVAWR